MTGEREQFDSISIAAPVPGKRTFGHFTDGGGGFDVARLPEGSTWRTVHSPGRARPFISATIPAARRGADGKLRTTGTTGLEGVSVLVGPWGSEPVEWATVQVSGKALHGGENIEPLAGDLDLAQVLDLVQPILRGLGSPLDVDDATVARLDSVIDFQGVQQHGRYVAAFAQNRPAVRGGRHVMHANETLAQHFNGGMSRLYNKHLESKLNPLALGRSRYEYERKRARLGKVGVDVVRDLDLARLDREARAMFEASGYGRDVAPMSDWIVRLLAAVPVYEPCPPCTVDRPDLCQQLDDDGESRCGLPRPGYGPTTKKGALSEAILARLGYESETHRNTATKYRRLYEAAGVVPEQVALVEPDDGDVVFLDLHSQTERRRERRTG